MLSKPIYIKFILPKPIDKELLSDVVLAVGILKSKIELVLIVQHVKASPRTAWTCLVAAGSVDVNRDVLAQLLGVFQAPVSIKYD